MVPTSDRTGGGCYNPKEKPGKLPKKFRNALKNITLVLCWCVEGTHWYQKVWDKSISLLPGRSNWEVSPFSCTV